jgi:hypothetical protein
LYVSNAALKMDTKLDCEVDVEGTVDMMVRGEGAINGSVAHVPNSEATIQHSHAY